MPNDRSFMRAFVCRVAGLLSRSPRPVVFDESCISVARPGDVVVLRLPEYFTAEMQERAFADAAARFRRVAPGVKFLMIDTDFRVLVVTSTSEGRQG